MKELKGLRLVVDPVRSLENGLDEVDLLLEMVEEGGEVDEVAAEIENKIRAVIRFDLADSIPLVD